MKPIIVLYINVDRIDPETVERLMKETLDNIQHEDYRHYLIPVHGQPSKVECINPILATEEEYQEICKKLTEYTDKILKNGEITSVLEQKEKIKKLLKKQDIEEPKTRTITDFGAEIKK